MKKKILAILLLCALALGTIGSTAAFATVSLEECDRCFQTTVNGLIEGDEVEGNKITAFRKPVYDIFLQQLGCVYEFEIASGKGYAIIICDDGNYIAQELVTSAESPYASLSESELCVYVNSMTYLKSADGALYDIETSAEISVEAFEIIKENAIVYKEEYAPTHETLSVTVNYQTRTTNAKNLSRRIPQFSNAAGLTGACAAVAGTNLVGFYDRYYEDLIPNHAAGIEGNGYFLYGLADSYVYDAMREMYADMNGTANGITESDFKDGLQAYCAKRSLSCDFTSLMSGSKFNYSAAKQSIEENKPIALLLSTYTICDIRMYETYDSLNYRIFSGNHVMAGFGYCDIDYTMKDGSKQSYNFVYVATGYGTYSSAYFNIDYKTNINSAYKVYVH